MVTICNRRARFSTNICSASFSRDVRYAYIYVGPSQTSGYYEAVGTVGAQFSETALCCSTRNREWSWRRERPFTPILVLQLHAWRGDSDTCS
jgi:hypothetical protein